MTRAVNRSAFRVDDLSLRVRVANRLCRSAVNEMRDFYLHAAGYFDRRIKQFERKFTDDNAGTEYGEYISDHLFELREYKNLAGYFAVLMMFSAFERLLQDLYDDSIFLAAVPELRDVILRATRGRMSLDDFRSFFKVLGIDLGTSAYHWSALCRLQNYRNAIAHQGGWVTESNLNKVASHGHKLGDHIEISLEFVTKAGDLIDKTANELCGDFVRGMRRRRPKVASKKGKT
jgi:hypothetical protein